MKHADLIAAISRRTGLSRRQAQDAAHVFVDLVAAELADGRKIAIPSLGRFSVSISGPCTQHDVMTGNVRIVGETARTSFRPAAKLRRRLKKYVAVTRAARAAE